MSSIVVKVLSWCNIGPILLPANRHKMVHTHGHDIILWSFVVTIPITSPTVSVHRATWTIIIPRCIRLR